MLSRAARQRIGALIRAEAAPPKPSSRKRLKAGAPAKAAPEPTREIIPIGIEEILPGGELTCREGAIFVHERLYTELREKPGPLLRKYEGIIEGRRVIRRARDLP